MYLIQAVMDYVRFFGSFKVNQSRTSSLFPPASLTYFDTLVSISLILRHGYFYLDHYRLLVGAGSAIQGVTSGGDYTPGPQYQVYHPARNMSILHRMSDLP